MPVDQEKVIQSTKAWIEKVVIGLNLCPFAKYPYDQEAIKYVVYDDLDIRGLLNNINIELENLVSTDCKEIETSLLIYPTKFSDFYQYLEFLDLCQAQVEDLHLDGIVQLASFHPLYQFDDLEIEDVRNYTNRSPYPMIHLLREASVSKAVLTHSDIHSIPTVNQELLLKLGKGYFT